MNQLRRPLVVALFVFLFGLLSALRFPLSVPVVALAFLLLLAASAGSARTRWVRTSAWTRGVTALLLVASGATVGTLARIDAAADCRAQLGDDVRLTVDGRLGAAYRSAGPRGRVPLIPLVDAHMEGLGACGRELRVRLPISVPDLPPGAPITVQGRWRTYATAVVKSRWPRDPRHHGFLLADTAYFDSQMPRSTPATMRARAYADASFTTLFPDHLEVVEALILGRREYMDPSLRDRFARAGLSHLLAISGMHVGLLAGVFLLLGSVFRLSRRRAILATLTATWLYLWIIGAPPSALRAGTMISLGLCALLVQRPSATTAIMAFAAFALLALNPLSILDPGFQLSFAGVLGILLLRPPLLDALPNRWTDRKAVRSVLDTFVVGVAAFIATAPIVAHHFGIIAPISIVVGPPAVPLMSLAIVGAASALALHPVLPSVAAVIASGAGLALDALEWVATRAAGIPYGNGSVPPPPWWTWSAAILVGLLSARFIARGGTRLRWMVGSGAALAVFLFWPILAQGGADGLEIHFIDVGQGDATAIRTPGNRWILVDAGPANAEFDAGERRVVPFLRSRGVRRLEALVLTHPDLDHIGGAPAVLRAFPVSFLFEPGHAVGKWSYVGLLGAVEDRGTSWRAARTGRTMELDGVRFDFLWPDPETVDVARDANQISAVIRVSYGAFALLLTGDADVEIEEKLVDRHRGDLRSTVLKLGHHGSVTSTAEALVATVQPELAVVSAGRRNRYGHPAPSVMQRIERRRIDVARTDHEGTVSLKVGAGGHWWNRE